MARDSYQHYAKKRAVPGAPLIFTFHGTGADEHQFTGLVSRILPEAGIVSPRGDVSERGAARFFRRTGEGIYDMDDLAARTHKMIAFIAAHRALYPDAIVMGLGYSNGANILGSVLFERGDLFDRVVLMHPLLAWAPPPRPELEGLDLLITAGRRDPICPLPETEALAGWFEAQGAHVELRLQDGGHEVSHEELLAISRFLGSGNDKKEG